MKPDWACQFCGAMLLPWVGCVVCGGNAARAGRLSVALGTRVRYLKNAGPIPSRYLTLGARLKFWSALEDWTIPGRKHIGNGSHWIDAGYCLDAPDELPAGGCRSVRVDRDVDEYLCEQMTVFREGAGFA